MTRRSSTPRIVGVDLFCGVGGLTHGLTLGGVKVVAGVDLDPHCRFPYEFNNDAVFLEENVRLLESRDLDGLFGSARYRLLAGCAPCQPFSSYSRGSRRTRADAKWDLVADFGRLIASVRPELVTMENVPHLVDHPVFQEFLGCLTGYHVWWNIVECAGYGVPQARRRLVLLASRLGAIALPEPERADARTVRDAIKHLPRIKAGQRHPDDPLHASALLTEINLRRIRASRPGGTWRDWDRSLVAKCHRRASGRTFPSVYGRMEWDAPSPTITTQCYGFGNGRFGHPEQHRAISLREAAILQTFPDRYQFIEPDRPVHFSRLGRLIGNAVPVRLGEVIAQTLVSHVRAYPRKDKSQAAADDLPQAASTTRRTGVLQRRNSSAK
jgi:DNA (cytosine-5)-methyltransferase 1